MYNNIKLSATEELPGQFQELTVAIPQLLWSALPDGQIDFRNRRAYELLGIEPASDSDRAFETAIHPDDREEALLAWENALANGQMFEREIRFIHKITGEARWYLVRAVPVREASGRIRHWVGTNTDVHAMHQAYHPQSTNQSNPNQPNPNQPNPIELAHLARVNTMGQLATGLAHELNQPLGAILNYAGMCSELLVHGTAAEGRQAITQGLLEIAKESQRAGEIIRRLRALIRKGEPHRQSVDLNHEVTEIAGLMNFDLRESNVLMKFRLEPSLPAVWADPVEIQQVMVNLMQNAIDALSDLPDRREIIISTTANHRGATVHVCDNGPGIDEAKLETVFDPFVTTKATGLGMGLSISRSIINSHNGEIRAESRPGKTVFSFILPLESKGVNRAAKFN